MSNCTDEEKAPLNPPSDREFGRLEGKVDELGHRAERVEQAVVAAAAASSAEHADVGRRLERLGEKFEVAIANLSERTDSLERTRDKGEGAAWAIKIGQGLVLFVIALLATGRIG